MKTVYYCNGCHKRLEVTGRLLKHKCKCYAPGNPKPFKGRVQAVVVPQRTVYVYEEQPT